MNTNLNPANALFLANLNRIEERLASASSQVSSGKKITMASDAPDQIDSLLQLRADQQKNSQIQANLVLAQADAQGADGALTSSISLLDRATTIAAEGASSTMSASSRASLAPEAQSLLEQMVSFSQTQVQGRYIFSGDQDGSPSYQVDLNAADGSGVDVLSAAASTRVIEDPAGGSFAASKTAQNIFGPTTAGRRFRRQSHHRARPGQQLRRAQRLTRGPPQQRHRGNRYRHQCHQAGFPAPK